MNPPGPVVSRSQRTKGFLSSAPSEVACSVVTVSAAWQKTNASWLAMTAQPLSKHTHQLVDDQLAHALNVIDELSRLPDARARGPRRARPSRHAESSASAERAQHADGQGQDRSVDAAGRRAGGVALRGAQRCG